MKKGWLDKYENGGEYLGTTNKGFNYNGVWGGPSMQMGGNIQPPMAGAVQTVPEAQTGTRLSPVEEIQYQTWRVGLPKNLQSEGDYDLRGLWKENPNIKPSANLHFPDTYKLPNHPTFSDESRYFNPKTKKYAGHWNETDSSWNYMPYDTTIKKMIVEKKLAMGGNIPGSVGFTYARTQGIPSEGPYGKKTVPSAENGMSFYQHGLDWTPRNISRNGSVVKDNMGYWNPDNWGKVVEIDSPNITMKGVNQDLIGVSDEGDVQYMEREKPGKPGKDYKFKGKKVKEYPVGKYGINQQDEKTVQHLDQLLNFTNKPKAKNGWLDKYN